jgi:hypothetical protein
MGKIRFSALKVILNTYSIKNIFIQLSPIVFWTWISLPARLSTDSLFILDKIQNHRWSELHTITYQIFVFLTSISGRFITLTIIFQQILLLLALQSFFKTFAPKISSRTVAYGVAILLLSPYGGGVSSAIWKDSLSVSLTIFFLAIFKNFIGSVSTRKFIPLLSCGLFLSLVRRENIYIVLVFIIFAIIYCAIKGLNKIILSFFTLIVILVPMCFATNFAMSGLLKAEKAPKWTMYQAPLVDLAYLSLKYPSEQQSSYVSKFSTGDSLKGSRYCPNIYPFVGGSGFNPSGVDNIQPGILETWFKASLAHPVDFIEVHLCRTSWALPYPLGSPPKYVYFIHPGVDANNLGFRSSSRKIVTPAIVNLGREINRVFALCLWPGIFLTGALLITIIKRRQPYIWPMLYCLASSFIIFLTAPVSDLRYGATISQLSCLVLILEYLKSRDASSKEKKF